MLLLLQVEAKKRDVGSEAPLLLGVLGDWADKEEVVAIESREEREDRRRGIDGCGRNNAKGVTGDVLSCIW